MAGESSSAAPKHTTRSSGKNLNTPIEWQNFKIPEAMWLKGKDNLEAWKHIIENLARASGYRGVSDLDSVNDTKLASQLLRTVTPPYLADFDFESSRRAIANLQKSIAALRGAQQQEVHRRRRPQTRGVIPDHARKSRDAPPQRVSPYDLPHEY